MNNSRYILPAILALLSLMGCMVFGLGFLAVAGLHYQDALAINLNPTPETQVLELPITPFPIAVSGEVAEAEVLAARREQTFSIESAPVQSQIGESGPLSSYPSEANIESEQASLSANNPDVALQTATPTPTPTSVQPTATQVVPTATAIPVQATATPRVYASPTFAPTPTPKPFIPGQLIIPGIGVNQYVVNTPIRNNEWDLLNLGHRIGWLPTTGIHPGDDFAMVFAAHVTDYDGSHGPFYELGSLPPGSEFTYRWQGTDYVYQIQEKEVVHPGAVDKLYINDGSYALLITCTNWNAGAGNYSERVIAYAKLIRTTGPDSG